MRKSKVGSVIATMLAMTLGTPGLFNATGKPRQTDAERKRGITSREQRILKAQERREKKKQFQLNQANCK